MTLTYNPDLGKVKVNSHTKNQGRESAHTDTQTDRQKHGSDSMTSTADAGGNDLELWQSELFLSLGFSNRRLK